MLQLQILQVVQVWFGLRSGGIWRSSRHLELIAVSLKLFLKCYYAAEMRALPSGSGQGWAWAPWLVYRCTAPCAIGQATFAPHVHQWTMTLIHWTTLERYWLQTGNTSQWSWWLWLQRNIQNHNKKKDRFIILHDETWRTLQSKQTQWWARTSTESKMPKQLLRLGVMETHPPLRSASKTGFKVIKVSHNKIIIKR